MPYSHEQKQTIQAIFEDDFVIKKQSKHSLEESLNGYTKDKLLTLKDIRHIDGITTRDLKQEIVDTLLSDITDTFATECLYLSRAQVEALSAKTHADLSLDELLEMDFLIPLLTYGWVYMYREKERYTLVFPDELFKILEKQTQSEETAQKMHLNQTALDMLQALVNLYGTIQPTFFQDVWRVYQPNLPLRTEELETLLTYTNRLSFSIESDGQWIYHKQHLSQQAAHQLGKVAKQHKQYWPSQEDLTYYTTHFYDTRHEAYQNFRDVLKKIVPADWLPIAEEQFFVHTKLATHTKQYMTFFKENDFSLGNDDETFTFSHLYMKAYAVSKTWPQAGYSEQELTPIKRPSVGKQLDRANVRIKPKAISPQVPVQSSKKRKKKIIRKK